MIKKDIRNALGHYLSRSMRSQSQAWEFLKKNQARFGVDDQQLESLMETYKRIGLIDDERFTQVVIHSQLSKGKGRRSILQKLRKAGIDIAIMERYLDTPTTEDVQEAMSKRLRRFQAKWQTLDPRLVKMKAFSTLLASGFQTKDISPFIDLWLETRYNRG